MPAGRGDSMPGRDRMSRESSGRESGDLAALVRQHDVAASGQGIRQRNAKPARDVIVAGARIAKCVPAAPGREMAGRTVGGNRHHRLQHAAHRGRCEPEIVIAALARQHDQMRIGQLPQMAAGGLRRYASGDRESLGRQRPAVQERREDVGPRGIADHRGGFRQRRRGGGHERESGPAAPAVIGRQFGFTRSIRTRHLPDAGPGFHVWRRGAMFSVIFEVNPHPHPFLPRLPGTGPPSSPRTGKNRRLH